MDAGAAGAGAVESVATREVAEYTRLVSERFAPLTIESDSGMFRGAIRGRRLGEVEVFDVKATQHRVERSGSVAARSPKSAYMLHLQLSGVGIMRQDGREAVLQPGDLAFYDSDQAYSLSLDDGFRNAILVFPQRLLDLPADATRQFTATRISGAQGVAAVVAPFLAQLAERLDGLPAHSGLRLAHNTVDLIATVLRSDLGMARADERLAGHRHTLLTQVLAYIEDNLGDPSLGPQQIAAAHFVSVRTLHGLFSREGTSVSAWIRERRLQLCRDDLSSRLHAMVPIGMVATRHGLIDPAHFSRLFKSSFGESPSEFRRRMHARADAAD